MKQKDRRFTPTCLIVMLALALPISILRPWSRAMAGQHRSDTARVERAREADRGKEQIVILLRDLEHDENVDHERVVKFLLGIDEVDKIDEEQIAALLGIDDAEETDYERILRLLLGLEDDDGALENEQLARLLLGIHDDDATGREQIGRSLDELGAPSDDD